MKSPTKVLYNNILSSIFLICTAIYLIIILWQNQHLYTEKFNGAEFKKLYEQSQWMDPRSKKPIGDDYLYTYAGYRYIHGENPILINPEVPPAGKYLIGLSIQFTGNQRIMTVISGIVSLYFIYLITSLLSKSHVAGSVAVFLTATHTLFTDQLIHAPQLDMFHLMFLVMFVYAFLQFQTKKTTVLLITSGVLLGLFMSIKLAFAFLGLMDLCLALYYIVYIRDLKKTARDLFIMNTIALLVFTIDYGAFFVHGGTLRSFLGTQKWIYLFYSSSKIETSKILGSYIGLILTNSWRVWSTGYPIVHYDQWGISWPVLFITGILSSIWLMIKTNSKLLAFIFIYICVYNIFLFAVPVFPRYLLILFVPLHIMIATTCSQLLHKYI